MWLQSRLTSHAPRPSSRKDAGGWVAARTGRIDGEVMEVRVRMLPEFPPVPTPSSRQPGGGPRTEKWSVPATCHSRAAGPWLVAARTVQRSSAPASFPRANPTSSI